VVRRDDALARELVRRLDIPLARGGDIFYLYSLTRSNWQYTDSRFPQLTGVL
jgi:hypothetical protein